MWRQQVPVQHSYVCIRLHWVTLRRHLYYHCENLRFHTHCSPPTTLHWLIIQKCTIWAFSIVETSDSLYFVSSQAAVYVLFHATAIYPGFQTTVHIGNIRQTAVIEGIMATGGIHTNEKASVLFRFLRHPEYVKVGMRLLFREGRTKGIGKITQVFPLQQD